VVFVDLFKRIVLSDHHEGGRRIVGTACDWAFSSRDAVKGELHTPDSVLFNVTTCRYEFHGAHENDRIELQVIAEQRNQQSQQQQQRQQQYVELAVFLSC